MLLAAYGLISDDNTVFLQQRLDVLDKLRSRLLDLDIVALSMSEPEELFKGHRDGRFAYRKMRTGP